MIVHYDNITLAIQMATFLLSSYDTTFKEKSPCMCNNM